MKSLMAILALGLLTLPAHAARDCSNDSDYGYNPSRATRSYCEKRFDRDSTKYWACIGKRGALTHANYHHHYIDNSISCNELISDARAFFECLDRQAP